MTITSLPCRAPEADLAARFNREVLPMRDVLSRGARRLTRNEADAEDLLQDTLMRAYTGFHNFQEGSNLQAWLFKILYNKWISGYRARQSRPAETAIDNVDEAHLTRNAPAFGPRSAEEDALTAQPDAEIRAAMASLPEGFAEVVHLTLVEGYTYAETAEMLDIPVGTVMSRVARGRQRLRIALAHRAPRGGRDTGQETLAARNIA